MRILIIAFCVFFISNCFSQDITEIGLLIDGSGSIDAVDFENQKDGIRVLLGSDLIPTDGTFALTIVQFGSISRIELPYTLLTSTNTSSVINTISEITQLGGGTNVGDGLSSITNELFDNGRDASLRVIALSVDGTNGGTGIDIQDAQIKGIDRLGVIAINCPSANFSEDVAKQEYEGVVFGGGSFEFVQNVFGYANIIIPFMQNLLTPRKIKLDGFEAVQVIQDLNNSVRLVSNKRTIIRAFISSDGEIFAATGCLRGYRNGVELLDSPLSPQNLFNLTIVTNEVQQRDELSGIRSPLYFVLPESWLSGQVTINFESIGEVTCLEKALNGQENDCSMTLVFEDIPQPDIEFVKIQFDLDDSQINVEDDAIRNLQEGLYRMFPISQKPTVIGTLTDRLTNDMYNFQRQISTANGSLDFQDYLLLKLRLYDALNNNSNPNKIFYGFLAGLEAGRAISLDNTGRFALGFNHSEFIQCHEIAHLFGIRHPSNESINSAICVRNGQELAGTISGPCGSCDILDDSNDFGYLFNSKANISPMTNNPNSQIWGFNSGKEQFISPESSFEISSYCIESGNSRWISDITYEQLMDNITSRPLNISQSQLAINKSELSNGNLLILTGGIFDDSAVSFSPCVLIEDATPSISKSGSKFTLRQLDSDNNILNEIGFDSYSTIGTSIIENRSIFEIILSLDQNTKSLVIVNNESGVVIGQKLISSNIPNVSFVSPNGGETFADTEIEIVWNGNDSDNDLLHYTLEYSSDNGANWNAILVNTTESSVKISSSNLKSTSMGLFRVKVSDGLRTSLDVSKSAFSVSNNSPQLDIVFPKDLSEYYGRQRIEFDAIITDVDDPQLQNTNISWVSDLDGPIETGIKSSILASQLSEGEHVITLKVIDDSGLEYEKSVSISVGRIIPMPMLPQPSISPIPTIGEWGLIILLLLLITIGVSSLKLVNEKFLFKKTL